jgi:putative NIF3 family GTP cyclohydrolase 1 type 2
LWPSLRSPHKYAPKLMSTSGALARYTDELLGTASTPDYPNAVNGLQLENESAIHGIAAAVDFSTRAIHGAIEKGANFLIVHHGMFWGGLAPLTRFQDIFIGTSGESDIETAALIARARDFAKAYGEIRASTIPIGRRTKKWGICTGAGASAETLAEAAASGIDTLIVGEGPHWTAIHAEEHGLAIIYAGHYATETLGVSALAKHLADKYELPWSFVSAPTGL